MSMTATSGLMHTTNGTFLDRNKLTLGYQDVMYGESVPCAKYDVSRSINFRVGSFKPLSAKRNKEFQEKMEIDIDVVQFFGHISEQSIPSRRNSQ